MTQPATTVTAATTVAQPYNAFDSYRLSLTLGVLATAICTLINPISGAALGTYFVTSIATNVALDMLGVEHAGTLGKVAKAVLSFFTAAAAAAGVLSLLGVSITFTPSLVGCMIAFVAINILSVLPSARN